VVSDGVRPGAGDQAADGLTDEDLKLGEKATKFVSTICLVAFIACVGVAVFVFMNVPWDTRMPYDGKYNRSGSGIPMQIAMLPALIPIFGFWKTARNSKTHRMGRGARTRAYIFVTAFMMACVFLQSTFAQAILKAGGFLPG
jgi:hypothetical protein